LWVLASAQCTALHVDVYRLARRFNAIPPAVPAAHPSTYASAHGQPVIPSAIPATTPHACTADASDPRATSLRSDQCVHRTAVVS
jgi:hypothetical protein